MVGVGEKATACSGSFCHFGAANCMHLECRNVSRWGVSQLCGVCIYIHTLIYIFIYLYEVL